jgi:phosphatidylinositol alpha-1,6-mannosyltransferase
MTILVLSQVFPPRHGGSGRWLWELYRRLRSATVHVAAGEVPGAAEFDLTSVLPTTRLPLDLQSWGLLSPAGVLGYARAFHALRRVVRSCAPDAIHCGKCLPEGLLAVAVKRWSGIPFVCFVHGEELTLARTSRELRVLTRVVLGAAEKVVANSRNTRRLLIEDWQVPSTSIVVMHPGVDTTRFVPAPADAGLRRARGWADRRVVLTVGALQKRKGQDMMIRSLPAIRAACPDVLYAIAGVGVERPYLEALVVELGVGDVVQFCGVPPEGELVSYYQQCDLFALPNRQVGWDFEGFGIVSLEAQACGKPVILGASGGTIETIDPGVTGELVACDEPEPLARAVIALLSQPGRRASMGASAREFVTDRFDWQVLTRQAEALFI